MAVFTEVSLADAQALVDRLGLGPVTALRGIASGIENTNYFVTTERGEWVLTLFERLTHAQLPFYLHLMKHLAQHGVPVPEPQAKAAGAAVAVAVVSWAPLASHTAALAAEVKASDAERG